MGSLEIEMCDKDAVDIGEVRCHSFAMHTQIAVVKVVVRVGW